MIIKLTRNRVYIIAYTIRTEPQNTFFDISSSALTTKTLNQSKANPRETGFHMVKPGSMTTTPADETAL
jgi:hypothetical protein